jgi:hypothetical protein
MISILSIALRAVLLYFVLKLLWSLFTGGKNRIAAQRRRAAGSPRRFETDGKNVADADYDEVK